jgi:endogenous inhibitor of DNA gyrase (YacG/DUF329 family)
MATRVCPECGTSVDESHASTRDDEGDQHGEGQGKQERADCPGCGATLTRAAGAGGPWALAQD